MARGIMPLALVLSGCSAIAPFGDFVTGGADGGGFDGGPSDAATPSLDAPWTPPGQCDGGLYAFDGGPPVDPMGVEICNRRDDDGDIRSDEDLLVAGAPRVVPGVEGVGDRLRATAGLRPDTAFVAFVSSASATRGRLRAVEARVDGEARDEVLTAGPVGAFDVAASLAGYLVAWVEGGQVRMAVIDPCAEVWGASAFTLATVDAAHVAIEVSRDGTDAYVVWSGASLGGVRVDLRSRPQIGPVGTVELPGVAFLESAVSPTSGAAWVSTIQRSAAGDQVFIRRLVADGSFGDATQASGPGFGDSGPLQNVHTVLDPEDFLLLTFDRGDATGVTGPAFAVEYQLPELRRAVDASFGGDARVVDMANDGSVSSGILLLEESLFLVERVGANPDGVLSTDAEGRVPVLDRVGWLAIVGFTEGPYRYVAVGRDEAGALRVQPVGCGG